MSNLDFIQHKQSKSQLIQTQGSLLVQTVHMQRNALLSFRLSLFISFLLVCVTILAGVTAEQQPVEIPFSLISSDRAGEPQGSYASWQCLMVGASACHAWPLAQGSVSLTAS